MSESQPKPGFDPDYLWDLVKDLPPGAAREDLVAIIDAMKPLAPIVQALGDDKTRLNDLVRKYEFYCDGHATVLARADITRGVDWSEVLDLGYYEEATRPAIRDAFEAREGDDD